MRVLILSSALHQIRILVQFLCCHRLMTFRSFWVEGPGWLAACDKCHYDVWHRAIRHRIASSVVNWTQSRSLISHVGHCNCYTTKLSQMVTFEEKYTWHKTHPRSRAEWLTRIPHPKGFENCANLRLKMRASPCCLHRTHSRVWIQRRTALRFAVQLYSSTLYW